MTAVLKKLVRNQDGQFAVWFGLLAFPLLAGTSFVMDFQLYQKDTTNLKGALDTAVLAAVQKNNLTKSEREAFAIDIFNNNFDGKSTPILTATATDDTVKLTAKGSVPTSISAAIGIKELKYNEISQAQQTAENTICVLALNKSARNAIKFKDNASFLANSCSVQSNSNSNNALVSSSSVKPISNNFCAVGGISGSFKPNAKSECAPIADPYTFLSAPAEGPCLDPKKNGLKDGDNTGKPPSQTAKLGLGVSPKAMTGLQDSDLGPTTGDYITLPAGTYCKGLTVDGIQVRFEAGLYNFGGPLVFKNNAEAIAENVTFALTSQNAKLVIEKGATLTATASKNGPFSGLVVFQRNATAVADNRNNRGNSSVIQSGGSLNVTGTIYLPEQGLIISGDSTVGASSPALAFIANTVTFQGSVEATVSADAAKAGLPPIKPNASDGARLVR